MNDVTHISLTEVQPYAGPHAIPGIRFRALRAALGVTAWGMNVLELDPHCEGYPEHDHKGDAQEEVYMVLDGEVWLRTGASERRCSKGDCIRVAPNVLRKFITRDASATLLALGGTPGQAFTPQM